MRTKLWLGVIISTSALAACGDGKKDPDAAPRIDSAPGAPDARVDADPLAPDAAPEFACLGQPIPGTAPATLTVAGDMQALGVGSSTIIEGATVNAFIVGTTDPVGSDVTDDTGAYSISIANPSNAPIDAYLVAASPGNKTVYLFPPTEVYADLPIAPLRTIPDNLYAAFLGLAGGTVGAGNGVVAVVVADCLNNPLMGATVTAPGQGANVQIRYNGANGLPSSSATSTAVDGIAYILDIEPGPVTVDAMYMGMDFREHTLNARPADGEDNAINTTIVHP